MAMRSTIVWARGSKAKRNQHFQLHSLEYWEPKVLLLRYGAIQCHSDLLLTVEQMALDSSHELFWVIL